MVFGMLFMLLLIVGGEGTVAWLIWRRMGEYLKENPEAVAALTTHLFVPLMGKKAKPEEVKQPQV